MKFLLSAILPLIIVSPVLAQDIEPQNEQVESHARFAIKGYNITTFNRQKEITYTTGYRYTQKSDKYFSPAAALNITNKKGNAHEIELSDFTLNTKDNKQELSMFNGGVFVPIIVGERTTNTAIAVRYEYIINFAKKKDWRLKPMLGIAGQPYYERERTVPYSTVNFNVTHTEAGIRGYIIPRINFDVCKHLFFDLNIPVCVADGKYYSDKRIDPTTSRMRDENRGDFNLFAQAISIRVGAGIRLSSF